MRYVFLLVVFYSTTLFSQTFVGGTGPILDLQTIDIPVNVSGLPTSINQTTFGLEQICFNITHTYVSDITFQLLAPDGTVVTLFSQIGGGSHDFTNTCLRADATTPLMAGSSPYTGTFKPQGQIGLFNNNQNPNGTWIIRINDNYGADEGTLNSCSITFGNNPATTPVFQGSDIPLFLINTFSNPIPDEPKINATLKVIDNGIGNLNYPSDPANIYSGFIGIEQRGSSSATFPQKSYGFETRNASGLPMDTALCGMPSEHDWILYAPYNDKSCIRNILTYHLSNQMGNYASRTKLCEVFLNNDYDGIYVLMEKIKRDNGRVDIAKLQAIDSTGDQLTGGYIVKIDKGTGSGVGSWTSNFQASTGQPINFYYHYPSANNITAVQQDYIQKYVDSFEVAINSSNYQDPINGYRKYAKTETFVDFLLINELSKNVDGYRISTYFHKDKDSKDGRLRMGPVWDFNLGWWNADYCEANLSSGFAYELNSVCGGGSWDIPIWWERMMQDPSFQFDVRCRYDSLRETILSETYLFNYIDSLGQYLNNAKDRHFEEWPILGIYTWPNPSPLATSYQGELDALKSWIHDRLIWLDANLPGICNLSIEEKDLYVNSMTVYPNPAQNEITIRLNALDQMKEIKIYSLNGSLIKTMRVSGIEETISIEELPNGNYLIELQSEKGAYHKRFVKSN